jgi:NAD(P)-dependent dehydrogenase (short-subunit alcohol dehydrogenase family)
VGRALAERHAACGERVPIAERDQHARTAGRRHYTAGRNAAQEAATKAGLSALAEGIRAERAVTRTPIAVTTLHPGYIATDLSAGAARTPLLTSTDKGVRTMVKAIERERPEAKALPGRGFRWDSSCAACRCDLWQG